MASEARQAEPWPEGRLEPKWLRNMRALTVLDSSPKGCVNRRLVQFIVLFQNLNIMACYANLADAPKNNLKRDRTTIAV